MRFKIPAGLHELVAEASAAAPTQLTLPTAARRDFVLRYAQAVRNESAVLSLDDPESPNFALGNYADLLLTPRESSILVTREPSLQLSPLICLLAGALGRIDTYEVPGNLNILSFKNAFSKSKNRIIKVIENPFYIERVYACTAYAEGRTIHFMRLGDCRKEFNERVDGESESA